MTAWVFQCGLFLSGRRGPGHRQLQQPAVAKAANDYSRYDRLAKQRGIRCQDLIGALCIQVATRSTCDTDGPDDGVAGLDRNPATQQQETRNIAEVGCAGGLLRVLHDCQRRGLGRRRGEGLGPAGLDRVRASVVRAGKGLQQAGTVHHRSADVVAFGGAGRDGRTGEILRVGRRQIAFIENRAYREIDRVREENKALATQLKASQGRAQTLQQSLQAVQAELSSAREQRTAALGEVHTLLEQVEEHRSAMTNASERQDNLRQCLQQREADLAVAREQYAAANARAETLAETLAIQGFAAPDVTRQSRKRAPKKP